jgi:hypothetical protein
MPFAVLLPSRGWRVRLVGAAGPTCRFAPSPAHRDGDCVCRVASPEHDPARRPEGRGRGSWDLAPRTSRIGSQGGPAIARKGRSWSPTVTAMGFGPSSRSSVAGPRPHSWGPSARGLRAPRGRRRVSRSHRPARAGPAACWGVRRLATATGVPGRPWRSCVRLVAPSTARAPIFAGRTGSRRPESSRSCHGRYAASATRRASGGGLRCGPK